MVGAVRNRQPDTFDSFPAGQGVIAREDIRPGGDAMEEQFGAGRCAADGESAAQRRIWPAGPMMATARQTGFAVYCPAGFAVE